MAIGDFIQLENVLTENEVHQIKSIVKKRHFENGQLTASGAAVSVKRNEQLKAGAENAQLENFIMQALTRHPMVQRAVMPKMTMPPIISRYTPGMSYGTHVDSPLNGRDYTIRTDVGITLFLNNPEEYEGGELEVMNNGEFKPYKFRAGDAICYPTTQLHRVNEVKFGERLVAVTWMQCVIRDAHKRSLVFQAHEVVRGLEKKEMSNSKEHLSAQQLYSNLVRLWAEL